MARIFNTYGPRMAADDGRVVSNVVTQALAGDDITVYGDGSQTRSFCYVDDLVSGLVKLMDHDAPLPGPVNLGNPNELSVGDLIERVLAMTGSSSTVVRRPLPVDDPRRRRPGHLPCRGTPGMAAGHAARPGPQGDGRLVRGGDEPRPTQERSGRAGGPRLRKGSSP